MGLYRKKPVVIEAFLFTGDMYQTEDPGWIIDAINGNKVQIINSGTKDVELLIHTLEGVMKAARGDWIIKGVSGELYPCKPDIFDLTYERVSDEKDS